MGASTFYKWQALYSSGGREAMGFSVNTKGNPRLTEKQESQLRTWIIGGDPRQFQFEYALWTRKIVAELIHRKFGVEYTPQGMGKLLRRLGFSPQRPLYRAYQQDPAAVTQWKETTFPTIRAEAKRAGATLYFADEAAVRTDHHAGTTWGEVGVTPVVTVTGERATVNMISAITPTGQLRFDTHTGRFTADVFIDFLKSLLADTPSPVFIIVDNARQHTAKVVQEFATSTEGRLQIHYLPTYSPELNPDEWVWKNIKNDRVAKKPVNRKSEFFEMVTGALRELQLLPDVIRGFFRDPALSYIDWH